MGQVDAGVAEQQRDAGLHVDHEHVAVHPVAVTKRVAVEEYVLRVRLTIDTDLRIHAIESATEASPYRICGEIAPSYRKLEGATIGRGWRNKIREAVGGRDGCTHISELLATMATGAFQTVFAERARKAAEPPLPEGAKRPSWIDSCYALREEGEVVRREWPQYARPSEEGR